jgi:hypothetical protein
MPSINLNSPIIFKDNVFIKKNCYDDLFVYQIGSSGIGLTVPA